MLMTQSAIGSARQAIDTAVAEFGGSLAVLTSFQREGVVILDLAMRAAPGIPVMTIDTGRLPESTHRMMREVELRYGIRVRRILPEPVEVHSMIGAHGVNLFREGVPQRMLCCNVRKIRPLSRAMIGIKGYFTGMRRGQSESRANIEIFDRSGDPVRISPLADWSAADVLEYTATHYLPVHPLYAAGYESIGCDPCTRAVARGEDQRAGRWWWENDAAKECGIHFSADGRAERTVDVLLRDLLAARNGA